MSPAMGLCSIKNVTPANLNNVNGQFMELSTDVKQTRPY